MSSNRTGNPRGQRYRPEDYQRAKPFLDKLNMVRQFLTKQEYLSLKGDALAGDMDGAVKGLERTLKRRNGTDGKAL